MPGTEKLPALSATSGTMPSNMPQVSVARGYNRLSAVGEDDSKVEYDCDMKTQYEDQPGSRLSIFCSVPHLVALLSFLVLLVYVAIKVQGETARQLKSEDLARRCAFVYLVASNYSDIDNLGFSLQSLNKYFNFETHYKIIIVHEGIPPVVQGRLQALSEESLSFREFQLAVPFDMNLSTEIGTFPIRTQWSYQNMIRFWFFTAMLAEPTKSGLLSDIDYIIRLDSNSAFTGDIGRDFIKDFVLSGAQFGYQGIGRDCTKNATYGLRQLAESYVDLNGISPRSIDLWVSLVRGKVGDCVPKFENHFEVINMRFFRSHSGIQDWIRVVDANGGIYRHRWGDAALRYITVALFAAPEKLVKYAPDAIPYSHPHRVGRELLE